MAKFKYRMQNILNIKLSMERQARMQYAAANMKLREEEEKLEAFRQRKADYEAEAKRLLAEKLDVREIMFNNQAIMMAEEDIKAQVIQVHTAQLNVERAREKMTQVMQERKTHELLKEKAFEQFLQELKQQESKEIDELTSYTYGQRIAENEEKDQAI